MSATDRAARPAPAVSESPAHDDRPLRIHPPRLVPLPAEDRAEALDLFVELINQWRTRQLPSN
jgi:hypothetical protein